jgi:hypothetical protein
MTVRFDESLPILARVVADELGKAVLTSGIALRVSQFEICSPVFL